MNTVSLPRLRAHSRPVFAALARALCALLALQFAGSTRAVTWCHDYTLHRATGRKQDFNRTGVDTLRLWLKKEKYRSFSFTVAAHDPSGGSKLRPGDVVIFGDSHSAFVNEQGLLDHFVQTAGQSGKAYPPTETEKQPNFRRGDTLLSIVNLKRTMIKYKSDAPEEKYFVEPYKNVAVEVWRPQPKYVKPTPPAKGGAVWVCDGPVVTRNQGGMKVSGGSATFTLEQNGKTGQGTINWSGVPLTVREGETITLKMNATGTAPAAALGWFNVNCDGERGTWDNNAASYPGGDTASPTPSATLVFKFQPRGSEATIQIVAGMNGGNVTDILYKYHRK